MLLGLEGPIIVQKAWLVKALLLQRFLRIPSEEASPDGLAKCRDYRRICGFRCHMPSRGCFTYLRRRRLGAERLKKAFEVVVQKAIALGAVKGHVLAADSTAFKACSARDASNKRGKSNPDADVGRAGRTYILGYRVHLACGEGDVPAAFTVQPISRNDKLFYKPLLEAASNLGGRFKVVVADRQCDSAVLRRWTLERFGVETAMPTHHEKSGKGLRVDAKFRVKGLRWLVKAYHKRLCVERVFKRMKRQLNLETYHLKGIGKRRNSRLPHADVPLGRGSCLLQGWKTEKGEKHKILDSLKRLLEA